LLALSDGDKPAGFEGNPQGGSKLPHSKARFLVVDARYRRTYNRGTRNGRCLWDVE
jgi:hypothetical protein